jgi:hypothetical protein
MLRVKNVTNEKKESIKKCVAKSADTLLGIQFLKNENKGGFSTIHVLRFKSS